MSNLPFCVAFNCIVKFAVLYSMYVLDFNGFYDGACLLDFMIFEVWQLP